MPLQERCSKNHWELADDYCNRCGLPYSNEYLVYPFGQSKPPMCVSCALAMAGVRSNAASRPAVSKKELRKRNKERKQRVKADKAGGPRVSMKPINIDWSVPEDGEQPPKPSRRDREAEPVGASLAKGEPELDDDEEDENRNLDWLEAYTSGGTAKKITF
jgi:hypothetical protein